ncbi:MAG: [FeFe] hydrogenase H-cluster maturation GTPase HydF [Acutalibacter sp.]|nr:[FeFe] hydrogenase H-cluster maturation GTPase HydF [Acutalibacter sp.]
MSLNETVSAQRPHIAFFGMRNAGKSSVVNAVTGQALAVVSPVKGTTTDPVQKAMELLPLGPVVMIDTPGLDDEGELGALRVEKTRQVLAKTDIAVLVVDAARGISVQDRELLDLFAQKELPFLVAYNKADMLGERLALADRELYVSARTGENIEVLKDRLGAFTAKASASRPIVADLIAPGDLTVLVTPIDAAAPKGRMILPQQQTMRDILDAHCALVTCQPEELAGTLKALAAKPKLVITDSQAFGQVAGDVPGDVLLTSFSILFARYKGSLATLVEGAARLSKLKDGDQVLISEGCTHHRQCGDIGTVKLPKWIEDYTGAKPGYCFTSGGEFPEDLTGFALVVHCGGCMLNEKEMQSRVKRAKAAGVPIVNYGVAIAQMHGILRRSLEAFPEILAKLEE